MIITYCSLSRKLLWVCVCIFKLSRYYLLLTDLLCSQRFEFDFDVMSTATRNTLTHARNMHEGVGFSVNL